MQRQAAPTIATHSTHATPSASLLNAFPGAACRYNLAPNGIERFTELNEGCAQLWELDNAILSSDSKAFWGLVLPQDVGGLRESFETSASTLGPWNHEWRIATPSGRQKWLHGIARPERGPRGTVGWILFITDVTQGRRTDWSSREHDARFRLMLDGISNVSVQGYGMDLTTRYWNKASERLYGFTAREAIGKNLIDLIIPEAMRTHVLEAVVKMVRTGEPIPEGDLVLQRKDGSPIEVFSSHAYVHIPGSDPELYCIDIDLTERRAATTERAKLETQLLETQKWEALGSLADGVAHDFNSIVTAIMGNAELALRDLPGQGPAQTSVEEIRKAGRRARDLLKQIFAFSHRRAAQREATGLQAIVANTSRLVRGRLPRHIEMQVNCAPDAPLVIADAQQMQQVLLNFCTNAWQAIPTDQAGLIALEVDAFNGVPPNAPFTWISPQAPNPTTGSRWARIRITDNGAGMAPETRVHIFEPFFTTKRPGEGAGLGLTVVHTILAEHHAVLGMQSTPGLGSVFTLYVPACSADQGTFAQSTAPVEHSPSVAPPAPASHKPAPVEKSHILFVDDDELMTFLMKRLLEKEGYGVTVFTDSKVALRAFCRQPDRFDLVISDHEMRGLSGLEFARSVKARSPRTPVVVACDHLSDTLRREAPAAGANEVFEKPDSVEALFAIIERLAESCEPKPQTPQRRAAAMQL
jgi:PAS domain S-box-containing protein